MSLHLVEAMEDRNLFAPFFGGNSWRNWKVFLKCLPLPQPLPLQPDELEIFHQFTGRTQQPETIREAYCVVGRGSGKSRIGSTLAVFTACFGNFESCLAPGQKAVIPLHASDKKQARENFNYASGLLSSIPALSRLVVNETKESIELSTRCVIEIRVSSFKSVRGPSYPLACCDELAFWWNDETSSNPDTEVIRALRPGLGRLPNSLLLGLSSPYAKKGHLWEMYSKHYGKDDSNIVVWLADTKSMNETFSDEIITEAFNIDEFSAIAEYGQDGKVEFRRDIESFLNTETVRNALGNARPPVEGVRYVGFTDASDGSGRDSFASAVAHLEGELLICDAVLEVRPPFVPSDAIRIHAEFFKSYGVKSITADRYAKSFVAEGFIKHGIVVGQSDKDKSTIYGECLPLFNSHRVEIPDNPRLVNQLLNLERRTRVAGKDLITEGNHRDDLANSCCGAILGAKDQLRGLAFRESFKRRVREGGLTIGTRPDLAGRFERFNNERRDNIVTGWGNRCYEGSRPVKPGPHWWKD